MLNLYVILFNIRTSGLKYFGNFFFNHWGGIKNTQLGTRRLGLNLALLP